MKFRVWDKAKKEMLYDDFMIRPGKINEGAEPLCYPNKTQSNRINKAMKDETASYALIDFSNFYGLENYEVMIGLGLQDKNNVEIFQGDILKIKDKEYEVKLNLGVLGLTPLGENKVKPVFDYIASFLIKQVEVIGNIWENSDKVEVK